METETSLSSTSPTAASNLIDSQIITRREHSLIDGILNNESLTSDLNDEDAKEMIDWCVAQAKEAARITAGMDEPQAEKIISERMYANRKLIRSIKRLIVEGSSLDERSHADLIMQIQEQARMIYGEDAIRRPAAQALLENRQLPASQGELCVAQFRSAFDPHTPNS